MEFIRGSELTSSHLEDYYRSIDAYCSELNATVYNSYSYANNLYNHSSVIEDILTNNVLSVYNKLNSIAYTYTSSSVIFIESFESLEYIDKKFHVDTALNIDTHNKTLTLPIKNEITNSIVSVIVEPDSNGIYGNSLDGFKNSDINAIFDGDISSIFEYEKFTSIFEQDSLDLILTLKLEQSTITNSLFLKLYSSGEIKYPEIIKIETSIDSILWNPINGFIENNSGQNDHYIRYEAIRTRYIRIYLKQSVSEYVSTGFGIKTRYSIGIREIQSITNEFSDNGDYVSIQLSSGDKISNVKVDSDFISNNDVAFYVSANNGGTWIPIVANGGTMNLLDKDTGVLIVENMRSLRLRIGMRKTAGSLLLKTASQLMPFSIGYSYQLLGVPTNLKLGIGGHISFGNIIKSKLEGSFPYNILNNLSKTSGIRIVDDNSDKIFAFFGQEETSKFYVQYTAENKEYQLESLINTISEYIFSLSTTQTSNDINNVYLLKSKYIPYNDNMQKTLELSVASEIIPSIYEKDGTKYILWLPIRDPNSINTNIYLDLVNLEVLKTVGEDIFINGFFSTDISINFKEIVYTKEDSLVTKNKIDLPFKLITKNDSNLVISRYSQDGVLIENIISSKVEVVDYDTYSTIIIQEENYSSDSTYRISFTPLFDLSHLLEEEYQTSLVTIQALYNAPQTSFLKFDYQYQDQSSITDSKYYSPICKNYTITLS